MSGRLDDKAKAWLTDTLKVQFGLAAHGIDPVRLVTLRKTFDYVRTQPPEQAVRPLGAIASELAIGIIQGEDLGRGSAPDVLAFQTQVLAELDGLKRKAETLARADGAKWQQEAVALPQVDARAAPSEQAKQKGVRAKAIQQYLADVEPGVERDGYMLKQVGADATMLNGITAIAAELKAEYAAMLPQQKAPLEHQAPKSLSGAKKPPIGAAATEGGAAKLSAEEMKKLNDGLSAAQAQMGKDAATDPAAVLECCALIQKGVDAITAELAMKRLGTWLKVKEHARELKTTDVKAGEKFMAEMWWYRRMVIDRLMSQLQQKYDFIWGSVGSDNPESDYDLTIRTHGKVPGVIPVKPYYDYEIVSEVNKTLSGQFGGAPPGIIFDCNLYAEAAAEPNPPDPSTQSGPVKEMGAMKEQGQDVGALMKLRRFMEWDAFEEYKENMLKGIADPAAKALMEKQFDEADSLYFIARSEQLQKAAELFPDGADGVPTLEQIKAIPNTPDGQKQLVAMAEALEHNDAKAMAANNAIYLAKLGDVRTLEEDYKKEADPVKKAALLAKLKTLQADATFFAAEAYHSEGPLLHVVKAGQASKLEIEGNGVTYDTPKAKQEAIDALKAAKLKNLSLNQMLQSFNENLGDLLKDLRHYASEPFPGLGFYRSSKYVERLCDAVLIIAERMPDTEQAKFRGLRLGSKSPTEVRTGVAGLVDIRGDKKGFTDIDGVDPEEEKQAFAIAEMKKIFPGVVTLPDLAKTAGGFGQEVNAMVRAAMAADLAASAATTGTYTGAGQRPPG